MFVICILIKITNHKTMASKRASGYVEDVEPDAKKQKPSQPSVEEIAVVSMIIDGIFYLTGINVKDGEPYYQALEAISEKHGITAVVKLTSGYVPGVSDRYLKLDIS